MLSESSLEMCVMRVWEVKNWASLSDIEILADIDVENMVIKKDLFQKLSDDSKYILDLLFNNDDQLLEKLATPKTKNITKRSLILYLETKYPHKTISKCFKELKNLAEVLV